MIDKLKETKTLLKIRVFLNFIYYFGLIGIICLIPAYFISPVKTPIFMLIISVGAYCCTLTIVNELIKINNTVIRKAPFVIQNVRGMQKIAICLFIISVCVFIKDWLRFKTHIFHFEFDNTGFNTDTCCLIFLLMGLFVLILAQIFKTAVEIKNENDLTV